MLIGLKKRKKEIHNPAGRGSSRPIWFAALFIWTQVGPNGSGRLDKQYRKYGLSEKQPYELSERRKSYAEAFQERKDALGALSRPENWQAEIQRSMSALYPRL